MRKAFVIMQLGNKNLDKVFDEAIVPAVRECGFQEERSDISTQGDLIPKEIFQQLEEAEIIIADLTNERPNCYFEVGYAMGLKKNSRLFLTARNDHNIGGSNRKSNNAKVHFDVTSFDILFWNPDNIDEFKTNLVEKINNRLSRIKPGDKDYVSNWDEDWIGKNRLKALAGLNALNRKGYTELCLVAPDYSLNKTVKELYPIVKDSVVRFQDYYKEQLKKTMPTGRYVDICDDERLFPKPGRENIYFEMGSPDFIRYQYWNLRKNGTFYQLTDFYEDSAPQLHGIYGEEKLPPLEYLFFDTRIRRILDLVLYAANLYTNFELPESSRILARITLGGLSGRDLQTFHRSMDYERFCHLEEPITVEIQTSIKEIKDKHVEFVHKIINEVVFYFKNHELTIERVKNDIEKIVESKALV